MDDNNGIMEFINIALKTSRFGVLATEGDGQPHVSLIAITPWEGFRQLVFATYRNTRKFRNLERNNKVAVLIEGMNSDDSKPQKSFVITAVGHAEEIKITPNHQALQAHLDRHPDLLSFTRESDCTLVLVKIDEYQVVHGIDKVVWWSVRDLDNT